MRKIFFTLMVIVLLMSCAPDPGHEGSPCYEDGTCIWEVLACGLDGLCHFCGDPEELCCEGNLCHECCVCSSDGLCHICGYFEDPCCEGASCEEGYVCGSDDICHRCGGDGEPCCEGDTCRMDWAFCGSDEFCHECGRDDEPCCDGNICAEGHICGLDGQCLACGRYNQICCDGVNCDEGLVCGTESFCISCGRYDQPCCVGDVCEEGFICEPDRICHMCGVGLPCPGNTCDEGYYYEDGEEQCNPYGRVGYRCAEGDQCVGWFECLDGICVNPFKVDSTSSLSICEAAEPGTSYSERDWCYWYAAYHKNDTSICERIGWDEMKEKCLDGKNPANYYVMPSF